MEKIKIMGAGPAGLAAAILLARAGWPVVVYERLAQVGGQRTGDLEALENWTTGEDVWEELNRWGLEKNFASRPMHSLTAFGPGFQGMGRFEDPRPLYYWCLRGPEEGSLDRGLLEQALELGVEVQFNRTVTVDEVDIVAGGFAFPRFYALGYTFRTSAPEGAYICLDDRLAPRCYSYLVLWEGRGTIATCAPASQRGMKQNLSLVVEGFHSRVNFDLHNLAYFSASAGFYMPPVTKRNGKLYIGEAGGYQDFLAAFGMRMGMTTAYLAVRSLVEGLDYDQLCRSRLWPILKTAAVNRWAFERMKNPGYRLLLSYMQRHPRQGRELLHRHYHPNWYTSLLWPFARRTLQAGSKDRYRASTATSWVRGDSSLRTSKKP